MRDDAGLAGEERLVGPHSVGSTDCLTAVGIVVDATDQRDRIFDHDCCRAIGLMSRAGSGC
jgi:hypothetical protein